MTSKELPSQNPEEKTGLPETDKKLMGEWLQGLEDPKEGDQERYEQLQTEFSQGEMSSQALTELKEIEFRIGNAYLKKHLPVLAGKLLDGWRRFTLPCFEHRIPDGKYGSNTFISCGYSEDHGGRLMGGERKQKYVQLYTEAVQRGDLEVIAVGLRAETLQVETLAIGAEVLKIRAERKYDVASIDKLTLGQIRSGAGAKECAQEAEKYHKVNALLEERGIHYDPNFEWQTLLEKAI